MTFYVLVTLLRRGRGIFELVSRFIVKSLFFVSSVQNPSAAAPGGTFNRLVHISCHCDSLHFFFS